MTRECSGCGDRYCDGACYMESPSDYETPQERHKRQTAFWDNLRAKYGDPYDVPEIERLTQTVTPPFRAMPDGPGSHPSDGAELHRPRSPSFDPYRKDRAA